MLAFHGKTALKAEYLDRLQAHRLADEIQHGFYWEKGKGCAVGCTVHAGHQPHEQFEVQLGIPQILARLEDRLFESLPNGKAKDFPIQFLDAIPVGADLSRVWYEWALWMLVDEAEGVIRFAKTDRTKSAIRAVGDLYARAARGEEVKRSEWLSARKSAYADAADAAAYADAAYAADAADAAYAAYAAADAAYADAGRRPYQAARDKAYERQAEKLLELLRAAPVPAMQKAA